MIKEISVLFKKKICKYLILLIVLSLGFSFSHLKTSTVYDNFYNTHYNQLESFKQPLYALVPECEENYYLITHINYLINRKDAYAFNIDMLEKKINSSLFKDDIDKLRHELSFENTRIKEETKFYDTYINEKILKNSLLIYCLYIVGIILICSLFYDDIQNGQLQIFKTYKNNLKDIFKSKIFAYLSFLSICTLLFIFIETIQLDGNYSIYNMESLSETFINLNLTRYVAFKYINAFFNTILFSTIFMTLLLVTRNYVISLTSAFLGLLVSFFTYSTSMSNLKYFNIYYFMFGDKFQYNGMNTFLYIVRLILCILFIVLFYYLYTKDFSVNLFKKSKKTVLKSTNSIIHILRELLIPSKGILAIAVVFLFSIYQYNTFKMSYDYKEEYYQEFKKQYLGPINDERYEEILDEYDEIQECYLKFMEIQEIAEKDEEKYFELMIKNEDVVIKAQKLENMGKLIVEFEEAMSLGLTNLVDNRGANLLMMKDQKLYLIECLSILVLPLIFVYVNFRKQMTLPSYITVIKTSKTGETKYLLLNNLLYVLLVILNTAIMIFGHLIKIKKSYPINLSYTLKDILLVNIGLSLKTTLFIFSIVVIIGIVIVSMLSYFIMNTSSSNKILISNRNHYK